jgi:CBS-domain-containing membrane protein
MRDGMSPDVNYCFEDADVDHVARNMGEQHVRRLPVTSRDKRSVGVLSLSDVAIGEAPELAGRAVAGISWPDGAHSQMGGARTGPGA